MKWLAIGLVLLIGCTHHYNWTHPNGLSQEDFRRDNYQCLHENQPSFAQSSNNETWNAYFKAQAAQQSRQMYQMCMEAKGYRLSQ